MKFPFTILIAVAATAHAGELDSILTPLAYAPTKSHAQTASADSANGTPSVVTGQGNLQIGTREVLDALQRELTSRYSLEGDLHVELSQPWKPIEVRGSNNWDLTITQAPADGLSSTSPIAFEIEAGGKVLGSWRENIKSKLLAPVWVAARRLDRGNALDSSVCTLKTVNILALQGTALEATTDLSNYHAAQTIPEGQALTQRDIALRPLVRKNQLVDVIVNEGPLQISMKGIALSTGGAGEMVSVRNVDSKKDFQAQVISPSTVQVRF